MKFTHILVLGLVLASALANSTFNVRQCDLPETCDADFAEGISCSNNLNREINEETKVFWQGFQADHIPEGWVQSNSGSSSTGCQKFLWKQWDLETYVGEFPSHQDSDRSEFSQTCDNVLVADGGAYACESGAHASSVLTTSSIALPAVEQVSLYLVFQEQWKQPVAGTSLGEIEVQYDGGVWVSLQKHTQDTADIIDEFTTLELKNLEGATSFRLRFTYQDSGHGQYWMLANMGVFQQACKTGFMPKRGSHECVDLTCPPKHFRDGDSCVACKPGCLTCENGETCTSCIDNLRQGDHCTCPSGHVDVGGVCRLGEQCKSAQFKNHSDGNCISCSLYCMDCSQNVFMNANPDQQMISGCSKHCGECTHEEAEQVCLSCPYKCDGCDTTCETCADSKRTPPDCLCEPEGEYDIGGKTCGQCRSVCKTCVEAHDCVTCKERSRKPPECACQPDEWDNDGICQKCGELCETCDNADSCKTCKQKDRVGKHCDCPEGTYHDEETGTCKPCDFPCKKCVKAGECTECKDSTRPLPHCPCEDKQYDVEGIQCEPCMDACATCNNGTSCKTCEDGSEQREEPPTCECKEGTWDEKGQKCVNCDIVCKTCSSSEKCDVCKDTSAPRDQQTCKCPDGYWDNKGESCVPCSPECKTCSDANSCKECKDPDHESRKPPHCKCYKGTYDVNHEKCVDCDEKCAACVNGDSCTECKEDSRKLPGCNCRDGWFDANGTCERKKECSKMEFHNFHNEGQEASKDNMDCVECGISCQQCPSEHADKCIPECQGKCTQHDLDMNPICARLGCEVECHHCDDHEFCEDCMVQCKSCKNETSCVECKDSKRNVANDCLCPDGQFDPDNDGLSCRECDSTCATCSAKDACLTCREGYIHVGEAEQSLCVLAPEGLMQVKKAHLSDNHKAKAKKAAH